MSASQPSEAQLGNRKSILKIKAQALVSASSDNETILINYGRRSARWQLRLEILCSLLASIASLFSLLSTRDGHGSVESEIAAILSGTAAFLTFFGRRFFGKDTDKILKSAGFGDISSSRDNSPDRVKGLAGAV